MGFDLATSAFWDARNRGVSLLYGSDRFWQRLTFLQKQWKDIRDKYIQKEDEE
jgi:hypothetical protein